MAESRSGPHVRNGHGTLFDAIRRLFVKSCATKGFATTGGKTGDRVESASALSTGHNIRSKLVRIPPALSALFSCRAIRLTARILSGRRNEPDQDRANENLLLPDGVRRMVAEKTRQRFGGHHLGFERYTFGRFAPCLGRSRCCQS